MAPLEDAARKVEVFPRIRAGASLKLLGKRSKDVSNGVFPRIRAGASLKLRVDRPPPQVVLRFPPHSCGGLIEAGHPHVIAPEDAPFSPAFVRGPH